LWSLSMVRLRGKPCPLRPRLSGAGGDEAMRASVVPLGAAETPCRRCRRVTLAAGECGVKDQVSRTQPDSPRAAPVGSSVPGTGRIGPP